MNSWGRGDMSRRSILTALLVAHVALLSGCGVWNLAYVPGDLALKGHKELSPRY